jgi:signal transduction histidine kinase
MSLRVLAMLVALMVPCGFATAAKYTRDDAMKMVENATAFFHANGKDKLIAEVNVRDGRFHQGELYVYVTDLAYTILAHPVNPKLIGQYIVDVPDVDGKLYRKEMVEIARTKGRGWVDYKYKNPVSGKVEPKTSYLSKTGDMIIICGIYKP